MYALCHLPSMGSYLAAGQTERAPLARILEQTASPVPSGRSPTQVDSPKKLRNSPYLSVSRPTGTENYVGQGIPDLSYGGKKIQPEKSIYTAPCETFDFTVISFLKGILDILFVIKSFLTLLH